MTDIVPGKVIKTIAAFEVDDTFMSTEILNVLFSYRADAPENDNYSQEDVKAYGDFFWNNYGYIFNYGMTELLVLLRDNKNIIDHICIFSNNKSRLLCDIARYVINEYIGYGANLIDAVYPYDSKYRKSKLKTRDSLFKAIQYEHSDAIIDKNATVLFIDSTNQTMLHELNVVSLYVNPPYNYYEYVESLVAFYGKQEKLSALDTTHYSGQMKHFARDLKNKKRLNYETAFTMDYYNEIIETGQKFIDKISGAKGGKRKVRKTRRARKNIKTRKSGKARNNRKYKKTRK